MSEQLTAASVTELQTEIDRLRTEVAEAARLARSAHDRGAVENLFNRYMYLHNAFQDEPAKGVWIMAGTESGLTVPAEYHPYHPSTRQTLEPAPPVPHETFTDTFK